MAETAREGPDWPQDGLESVPCCPVCGDEWRELLYGNLADGLWFSSGGWTLHRCVSCSSAFLDPRPNRETISRVYTRYYTHHQPPAPRELRAGGIRVALLNGYLNARYGYDLSPASSLGSAVARLLPKRRYYADRAVRNLVRPRGRTPRLLDVGCGQGEFLVGMRESGWDVQGLERDAQAGAVAAAAGVPVEVAPIEEAPFEPGSFDAVTMNHVIEHLHDPLEALSICRRLLRPSGVLWIATPNLRSHGHAVFGRNWIGLDPPRHLVVFTRESLRRAVERSGFRIREFSTYYSAENTFPCSATVAAGEDPRDPEHVATRRSRRAIAVADSLARVVPDRSEEIVLVAERSSDAALRRR